MASRRSASLTISHWDKLLEDMELSVQTFYAAVEEALSRRQIPRARVFRVDWREGAPFSARREYLRVVRNEFVFDICGAPFGTGFFVSWWLGELPAGCLSLLSRVRLVGGFSDAVFRPATYYRVVVRFDPKVAHIVRERREEWQSLTEHGDGSVTLAFNTQDLAWPCRWVMTYQDNATVIGPPELAAMVQNAAKAILDRYAERSA